MSHTRIKNGDLCDTGQAAVSGDHYSWMKNANVHSIVIHVMLMLRSTA